MIFFRRLALHRFVNAHPPAQHVSPASDELIAAYEGMLPASLIELWRRKGLGFYGDLQLALIDPQAWQSVLDRWVGCSASPGTTHPYRADAVRHSSRRRCLDHASPRVSGTVP